MPVIDVDFYAAACQARPGWRRAIVPVRRIMRKLLKPMYIHQLEAMRKIVAAQDNLEGMCASMKGDVESVMAFGWDHAALVRRVAVLEDRLEELLRERDEQRERRVA